MAETYAKSFNVKYFVSLYYSEERIIAFRQQIKLSNTGNKDNEILESCSKEERVNMASLDGCLTFYFYFHLIVIHDLGFLIPFMSFEVEFLAFANFALS